MAWALQFTPNKWLDPTPRVFLVGHFEVELLLYKPLGVDSNKLFDSNNSGSRFDIQLSSTGDLSARPYCHYEVNGLPSTSIPLDEWCTLKVIRDATDSNQSTLVLGKIGARYSNSTTGTWDVQTIDVTVAGVPSRAWDATASDHSLTGQQPVLVDTIGSNDAIGSGFDTGTNDYWVDLGGGGNIDGTIAITMSPFTSSGSGNIGEAITGAVSELMDGLLISGAGVVGDNPTGTVNITMGDISSNAVGNIGEAVTGASLITMSDINLTSSGNIGEAVNGSVNTQADDFVIYGEGTFALAVTGTANIQMEDFVIYGRESQEGGIYGAISAMPIEIEEINAIPIEVITK